MKYEEEIQILLEDSQYLSAHQYLHHVTQIANWESFSFFSLASCLLQLQTTRKTLERKFQQRRHQAQVGIMNGTDRDLLLFLIFTQDNKNDVLNVQSLPELLRHFPFLRASKAVLRECLHTVRDLDTCFPTHLLKQAMHISHTVNTCSGLDFIVTSGGPHLRRVALMPLKPFAEISIGDEYLIGMHRHAGELTQKTHFQNLLKALATTVNNLVELHIPGCVEDPHGLFEEIGRIKSLRKLTLYNAYKPNLAILKAPSVDLSEVSIRYFGDDHIARLPNIDLSIPLQYGKHSLLRVSLDVHLDSKSAQRMLLMISRSFTVLKSLELRFLPSSPIDNWDIDLFFDDFVDMNAHIVALRDENLPPNSSLKEISVHFPGLRPPHTHATCVQWIGPFLRQDIDFELHLPQISLRLPTSRGLQENESAIVKEISLLPFLVESLSAEYENVSLDIGTIRINNDLDVYASMLEDAFPSMNSYRTSLHTLEVTEEFFTNSFSNVAFVLIREALATCIFITTLRLPKNLLNESVSILNAILEGTSLEKIHLTVMDPPSAAELAFARVDNYHFLRNLPKFLTIAMKIPSLTGIYITEPAVKSYYCPEEEDNRKMVYGRFLRAAKECELVASIEAVLNDFSSQRPGIDITCLYRFLHNFGENARDERHCYYTYECDRHRFLDQVSSTMDRSNVVLSGFIEEAHDVVNTEDKESVVSNIAGIPGLGVHQDGSIGLMNPEAMEIECNVQDLPVIISESSDFLEHYHFEPSDSDEGR